MTEILQLANKGYKADIINVFKDLMEWNFNKVYIFIKNENLRTSIVIEVKSLLEKLKTCWKKKSLS